MSFAVWCWNVEMSKFNLTPEQENEADILYRSISECLDTLPEVAKEIVWLRARVYQSEETLDVAVFGLEEKGKEVETLKARVAELEGELKAIADGDDICLCPCCRATAAHINGILERQTTQEKE